MLDVVNTTDNSRPNWTEEKAAEKLVRPVEKSDETLRTAVQRRPSQSAVGIGQDRGKQSAAMIRTGLRGYLCKFDNASISAPDGVGLYVNVYFV